MSRKTLMMWFPLVGLVACDTVEDEPHSAALEEHEVVAPAAESEDQVDAGSDALTAPPKVSESSKPPDALLVPPLAEWSYLDQGLGGPDCLVPPNNWKTVEFDDDAWPRGIAELGYGDGDERTEIDFGPSATNKCITQFFRHEFSLTTVERELYASLVVRLLRDDGAAVYLNGVRIVSSNLPAVFDADTPALSETDSEDRFFQYPGIANTLQAANVLAVEVHQRTKSNLDLSFNLELVGVLGANATRKTARISSKEATLDEDRPNTRLGLESSCKADGSSTAGLDQACLAQWSLASIPAGATIRAVHIDTNVIDSSSDRYEVSPVGIPWVEDKVTWNDSNTSTADDWDEGRFGTFNLLPPVTVVNTVGTGTKLITLPTVVVTGWLATPGNNRGLAIYNPDNADAIHFSAGDEGLELVVTYDP